MRKYDLIVIGGGPAGMAAALAAHARGVAEILIIERDSSLGGILNQCIHNGFGLHIFKKEETGPEYAERFIKQVNDTTIEVLLDTMVVDLYASKEVVISNAANGVSKVSAKAIILAMGCRERTRGAIHLPGKRIAGVFTAGTTQRYSNIDGFLVGKNVVVLGSGDIGLIMARRMTLEGAKVKGVYEIMPYSSGLLRNVSQCLDDYDIPLNLNYTVVDVIGSHRVEKVVVAKLDEDRKVIEATLESIDCDTLILSVGLIPETELAKKAELLIENKSKGIAIDEKYETSVEGIFACGNVVHVHDVVDHVSKEAEFVGANAAKYLDDNDEILVPRYKFNDSQKDVASKIRYFENRDQIKKEAYKEVICTMCPKGCRLLVSHSGNALSVVGNGCEKGEEYGANEYFVQMRILTSTIKVRNGAYKRLPIRSDKPIPLRDIAACMDKINKHIAKSPIKKGDILIKNINNTGADIIASRSM